MIRNILRSVTKKRSKETPWFPANSSSDLLRIRNIGIIAHIDAGKTTLTERMLYYCGALPKPGNVDEGTTVMDYMQQERERGITIRAAAITFNWNDFHINLIDTPGHVDFSGEVERSLRVMDGCVVVMDGVNGIQTQTESVWKQASKYHCPRIVFINKLDLHGASPEIAVHQLKTRFGAKPLLLHLPVGKEQTYEGNIDLISMKAIRHVDPMGDRIDVQDVREYQSGKYEKSSIEAREILLEELASLDDDFAEKYLSTSFDSKDILQAIRRVTLREQAIPILCGSALKNKGVQAVLDAVINYLPSPAEKPPTVGLLKGEKVTRSIGDKKLTALAYKVISNTERGSLLYARVYTGKLKSGDYIKIPSQPGVYEKLGRLLRVRANEYVDVSEISEGDIVAITGMKAARSGDTLIGKQDSEDIVLPGMDMPPPVFFCTLEAMKEADDQKIKEVLFELCREDPSLSVRFDEECGKLIVLGQGELHLEIMRDRLLLEFKIEAKLGPLQVAYREAVSNGVQHTLRLHKPDKSEFFEVSFTINKLEQAETSAKSFETALYGTNFDDLLAKVNINLLPVEKTSYTLLMSKIKEEKKLIQTKRTFEEWEEELLPLSKLSEDLEDLLIKEIQYAMLRGPLLSYPLINTQLTITDGLFSRRMTTKPILRETASKAIREAVKKAGPLIYEPIMSLEITATDEYVGDLISDLSSERRGEIVQVEKDSDSIKNIIKARVPLSEMVGYSTRIRSLTKGSGSFNMFFYKYEYVGSTKQQELVEGHT